MNAVLEGFAAQINACDSIPDAALFRFGDRVEDGRALALALWAPDYDLYRLNVDFGPGAKTGVMELFLPERPPAPEVDETEGGRGLAAKLEENAMNAPVMLDAVLAPLRLTLQEVCRWAPGTLLRLSPEAVSKARVVGAKGHTVAPAKLGQLNGFRAVRMVLKSEGGDETPERQADTGTAALPGAGGAGGMDLPDLPELPDLPDLPELAMAAPSDADPPMPMDLPPLGGEGAGPDADEDGALDALVEEELARAAARYDEEEDDGLPQTGGPSLAPLPALE